MAVVLDQQSVPPVLLASRVLPWWRRGARLARKKALGTIGVLISLFFLMVGILGPGVRLGETEVLPALVSRDPNATQLTLRLKGPSTQHWFGTDELGRDVFTRVVYGVRPSMVVGFLASIFGVGLGTLAGLTAGYLGGRVDLIVQRMIDGMMSFPPLVLLLTLASVFQPSLRNIIIIMVVFVAPSSSRVVRGAVLSVRTYPFVEAARTIGASEWRVAFRHVLPNVFAPVLVLVSVVIGSAILVEASASFLGFGVAPPNSSLGSMLSANVGGGSMVEQPWAALAPGIAITLIVLSFNLVGDALRDILDPRLRGSMR